MSNQSKMTDKNLRISKYTTFLQKHRFYSNLTQADARGNYSITQLFEYNESRNKPILRNKIYPVRFSEHNSKDGYLFLIQEKIMFTQDDRSIRPFCVCRFKERQIKIWLILYDLQHQKMIDSKLELDLHLDTIFNQLGQVEARFQLIPTSNIQIV